MRSALPILRSASEVLALYKSLYPLLDDDRTWQETRLELLRHLKHTTWLTVEHSGSGVEPSGSGIEHSGSRLREAGFKPCVAVSNHGQVLSLYMAPVHSAV